MSGQITDKESLQYLVDIGRAVPRVMDIHDNGESITKLIAQSDGKTILDSFPKPPIARSHVFKTLEGFINYINSEHCKNKTGVIFVSENSIVAKLNYLSHIDSEAVLSMEFADEYHALQQVMFSKTLSLTNPGKQGLTQKELWRLLISDLDGCIDKSLALMLMQINIKENDEYNIVLDSAGLMSGSGNSTVTLSVINSGSKGAAGEQSASIQTDWKYRGRIWECFEATDVEGMNCNPVIDLRLEILQTKGAPPRFVFHPKHMQKVIDAELQIIVQTIKGRIPENFSVFEGVY